MAIAFVQKIVPANFRGGGVNTLTSSDFAGSVTAGNGVIVFVTQWISGAAAPTSIADSKGNTYLLGPNSTIQGSCWIGIYYCIPIVTGGGTFNIQLDCADGSFLACSAVEFSGLTTTSPLDLSIVGAQDQDGSPIVVDSSPTQTATADQLIVGVAGTAASSGTATMQDPATTGYITIGIEDDASGFTAHGAYYKIVSSIGTQSMSATHALGTSAMKALLASFEADAGGGGGGSPTPPVGKRIYILP